ncbi:hypothetical protein [Atlantibacter hermannii]|uniref:hypothetical protein n=1 Tax=Atlantibacter hermannii TaxID=565 RepID=UPI0028ADBE54|nr:hypothetical protein [Atlantibacter hermannii]
MTMTAEQPAQLREGGAKRFLFTATVKHVEGYQTFFVDAETQEEAEAGIENGNGQIYEHELEVTDLDDFILDRVTTTDDFGDYPPISEADLVRMEYNAALCEMLPGIQYMDPPDGGSVTPLEQVRRMVADYRQRIAELEKKTAFLKEKLAQLANFNPEWDVLEAATDSLREHMSELTAANKRIAELEARTVTVKLPGRCECCYSESEAALFDGVQSECVDAFKSACHVAGINLTVEG